MRLAELWRNSPEQLRDKSIHQIIAFAGDGSLRDGNTTSLELREFLSLVSSAMLRSYTSNCRETPNSGLALQEVVNQIGARLGFKVTHGRYRGVQGHVGFDGLWSLDDHDILVEVKTTDTYRIDLGKIAGYRSALAYEGKISTVRSSALIVVGREDTGDLEAQIRGSRYAWDIRLISVDALERLLLVKEELEDPGTVRRIHQMLIPREFTKLDEIVDLLFSAAEDVREAVSPDVDADANTDEKRFTPVAFHDQCISEIITHLNTALVKRSRASFLSPDGHTGVVCAISKEHVHGASTSYWFAFHPAQEEFLKSVLHPYVAFGCGSARKVALVPFQIFHPWLAKMNQTVLEDRFYWHVRLVERGRHLVLVCKGDEEDIDITRHVTRAEQLSD